MSPAQIQMRQENTTEHYSYFQNPWIGMKGEKELGTDNG